MLNKKRVKELWKERKSLPAGYTGVTDGPFITMMKNQSGKPMRMAMYAKHTTKGTSSHTAYVAFDGDEWHIGCDNRFLTGVYDASEAEMLAGAVAKNEEDKQKILKTYNMYEKDTKCHFWTAWNGKEETCKHVKDLFDDLSEYDLETLEGFLDAGFANSTTATSTRSASTDLVATKLNQYSFKRNLLITGEKGGGKTRGVYNHLESTGLPHVFIGGDQDVEAIDLKGTLIPMEKNGNKQFVWVDGPLTEAFRRASNGEKIVLFIDELLRISPSGLSVLIPSLTLNHKNQYVLKTGRIIDIEDGVGKTETLYASRDNLWVIATTNIGAGYDVSTLDDALEDRFEYVEHNNDLENISTILTEIVAELGHDVEVTIKLLSFYKKMKKLSDAEELTKLINLRHLVQIAEDCSGTDDLYDVCLDRIPKWVERDMHGKLVKEQVQLVEKALAAAGIGA